MKNFIVMLCLCLPVMLFSSCSNDAFTEAATTSNSIENKDAILKELTEFTQYSIKGATTFYDHSIDYLDLDRLDDYISKFNFSNGAQSRSISKGYNVINYEDALKDVLSAEAYDLLLSYLSSPEYMNKVTTYYTC